MRNEHLTEAETLLHRVDISQTDPELGYSDESCDLMARSAQLHALLAIAETLGEINDKLGGRIRVEAHDIARAVARAGAQAEHRRPRA